MPGKGISLYFMYINARFQSKTYELCNKNNQTLITILRAGEITMRLHP